MAWHRSRIKRMKQAEKRHSRNVSAKRRLKSLIKKFLLLVNEKKAPEAKESLKKITSAYASSAKRGIIHKKSASRHISRLAKKANAIALPLSTGSTETAH